MSRKVWYLIVFYHLVIQSFSYSSDELDCKELIRNYMHKPTNRPQYINRGNARKNCKSNNANNTNSNVQNMVRNFSKCLLKKNTLIDTVSISSVWEFSFSIHLAGTVSDWSNLIQIITKNYNAYINIPGIYFEPNSYKFYMNFSKGCQARTNYNASNNYVFRCDYGWQTGEFHKIKLKSSSSKIQIIIDDVLQDELTYTGLCFGQEAEIYLSNESNPPAKVVLVDFEYDFVPQLISCEAGYHLNPNSRLCEVNQCQCNNGEASTGIDCETHDNFNCSGCDEGFVLNYNKTSLESTHYPIQRICENPSQETRGLTPDYELSFGIKLLGIESDYWRNIFYQTTDPSTPYLRQPALYMPAKSYRLLFCYSKECFTRSYFLQECEWLIDDLPPGKAWKTGDFYRLKFVSSKVDGQNNAARVKFYCDDILIKDMSFEDLCFGEDAKFYFPRPEGVPFANVAISNFTYIPRYEVSSSVSINSGENSSESEEEESESEEEEESES